MSGQALRMAEAAAAVGLSYERFRKVWRGWVAELGFPAPLWGVTWDAVAIEAWKARRSARQLEAAAAAAPASNPDDRWSRAWDQLERARRAG